MNQQNNIYIYILVQVLLEITFLTDFIPNLNRLGLSLKKALLIIDMQHFKTYREVGMRAMKSELLFLVTINIEFTFSLHLPSDT